MAFRHYTLTLTGGIDRLSSVLGDVTPGGPQDLACRQIILAADPANGNVVYFGGSAVSSTSAAFALDPTQATAGDRQSLGPFDCGAVKLSEIYAIGTANQRVFIGLVPY